MKNEGERRRAEGGGNKRGVCAARVAHAHLRRIQRRIEGIEGIRREYVKCRER